MISRIVSSLVVCTTLVSSVTGCEVCHPGQEPVVSLQDDSGTVYSRIYGVGMTDKNINETLSGWELPLSLIEDKSSFVLETSSGKKDTLTFFYRRDAKFESKKCGIRMYFEDVNVGEPTTFSYVSFTEDSHTRYEAEIFH